MNIIRPKIEKWKEKDFTLLSNNQAAYGRYKKYPYTYPLYEAFANEWDTDINNILITRGAEEGLKIVYEKYVTPGSTVLRPAPTFGMVEVFEQMNEAKVVTINYGSDDTWLDKITKEVSLIYIALPDNPTGIMMNNDLLYSIISKADSFDIKVLLDLTYYTYYLYTHPNTEFGWLFELNNVIVVDSLSKSHGLAGLRIGCVRANREIIDELKMFRPMDEVNSLAVTEGIKALESNIAEKNSKHAEKWKTIFKKKFPNEYEHTHTNFIILRFENNKHIYYYKKLYKKNILTRIKFYHEYMDSVLRIGIGSNKVMRKVLKELR